MIVLKIRDTELKRCGEVMSMAFEFPCSEERSNEEILKDVRERPKGRGQRFYTEKWAAFEDDDQTMMGFMFTIPYVVNFDGHACKMNGHRRRFHSATVPEKRCDPRMLCAQSAVNVRGGIRVFLSLSVFLGVLPKIRL